jgi:predicted dehydrogenase
VRELAVAIIGGAGFMGKAHSLAWDLVAAQIGGPVKIVKRVLVEPDANRAREAAAKFGWNEAATDWRAVVSRHDIDIVDVVTPPDTHAEIAVETIKHGKHVLAEKPLSKTMAQAQSMSEAALAAPTLRTQVGFNYRHNPAIRLAHRLIAEGRIGRVLQARFEYLMDPGFGALGWRSHKATGGTGAASDIGSHVVDMANYLVGPITSVAAVLQTHPRNAEDDHDIDDAGAFLARFEAGPLGVFAFSLKAWGHKNHIRFGVDGTEGAVAFDWNRRDQLELYTRDAADAAVKGFTTIHVDGSVPGTWFDLGGVGTGYLESSANQMIQLVDAILVGAPNSPTFPEGAYVQRVIEAVWASAEHGSVWEPVTGGKS